MGLIVDASIAVKWLIDEIDSEAAHLILDREARLLAPDLLVAEVCNTAWRRTRVGDISQAQCSAIVDRIIDTSVELRPSGSLAGAATSIALVLDHAVYDCFYLALAETEQLPLVTADRRFVAKLTGTRWQDRLLALGQF